MSSVNYTFSDLLNAIQNGNINQAETILQYLYQNGNISQNKYNYAEALITTMKSLGLENESIMNTINVLVTSFEQEYQNLIRTGIAPNIYNLALSIDAILKFFPQYETMIPLNVKRQVNKILVLFASQNNNSGASTLPAVLFEQIPAERPQPNLNVH